MTERREAGRVGTGSGRISGGQPQARRHLKERARRPRGESRPASDAAYWLGPLTADTSWLGPPVIMRADGLWVPIIRSWALTRGFALHPGTRNRYEIRYTRTQHRPASRQVNDHGRVSGTHRVCLGRRAGWTGSRRSDGGALLGGLGAVQMYSW